MDSPNCGLTTFPMQPTLKDVLKGIFDPNGVYSYVMFERASFTLLAPAFLTAVLITAGVTEPSSAQTTLTPPPEGTDSITLQDGQGRLNAARYQPVDTEKPIHIIIFEDSDESLALAKTLEHTLQQAGYLVADEGAPLTLSFEITGGGGSVDTRDQSILRLEGNDSSSIDERYRAHLNVFSSDSSSVLTGKSETASSHSPTLRYQLNLSDATTGKRLWEGWATAPILPEGGQTTLDAMTPVLVGAIGHTVRNQTFSVKPSR